MSETACSFETAVTQAARNDMWPPRLREHAYTCTACAESARVTAWLSDAAARLGREEPAPDPAYVWLRAEIDRQASEEQAAIRRRSIVAAVLALAAAGGAASAMVVALPRIAASVRANLPSVVAELPLADITLIGSGWLGLLVVLATTYLLALRPLR